MFRRLIASVVILCFICSYITIPQARAADGVLNLPVPGTMVNLSPAYQPALIKGMTINKDNPFLFDFIVDAGRSGLHGDDLKREGDRLVRYFFACLTIPEKDLWVNLSPYEKEKMVPNALGQTPLGRDLLAQDYILKQLTASLIYPGRDLGKEFWDRVYAKAQEKFGTTQIPINTFNKVWIVADKGDVYENGQTAIVLEGHLKVMLEGDYLAMDKHADIGPVVDKQGVNNIGSQIIREVVLPEIEKEVNTGKNFATLRQIFNSLILATWYKKNLREALLNQIYADKSIVKGVNLADPSVKEKIYQQYLRAYKKGVFNFIKEDPEPDGQIIPRKYFSGGIVVNPDMLSVRRAATPGTFRRVAQWIALTSLLFKITVFTAVAGTADAARASAAPTTVATAVAVTNQNVLDTNKVYTVKGWPGIGPIYRGDRAYSYNKQGHYWEVRVNGHYNGYESDGVSRRVVTLTEWGMPHRVDLTSRPKNSTVSSEAPPRSMEELLPSAAAKRAWEAQQQGTLNTMANEIANELNGYTWKGRKNDWIGHYNDLLFTGHRDVWGLSVRLEANRGWEKGSPFLEAVQSRVKPVRAKDGYYVLKPVPGALVTKAQPSVSPAMTSILNVTRSLLLAGLFLTLRPDAVLAQNTKPDTHAVYLDKPSFNYREPRFVFYDGNNWWSRIVSGGKDGMVGSTPKLVDGPPAGAVPVADMHNWWTEGIDTNMTFNTEKRYYGMDPQTLNTYIFSFNGEKNQWDGKTTERNGDWTDSLLRYSSSTITVPGNRKLPSWAQHEVPEFPNTKRGNFDFKKKYRDNTYEYSFHGGVWWALTLTPNGTNPMKNFSLPKGHFPHADALPEGTQGKNTSKETSSTTPSYRTSPEYRSVIHTVAGEIAQRTWEKGGIDLNAANMGMIVSKDPTGGVQINFNPEMIERFKSQGVWSADPIIVRVTQLSQAEMGPILGVAADN